MDVVTLLDAASSIALILAAASLFYAGVVVMRTNAEVRDASRGLERERRELRRMRRGGPPLPPEARLSCGLCRAPLEPERVVEGATFCQECEGRTISLERE